MSFKDNSSALYSDPNAYIQRCECADTKKVVFSEPYETMPNFYLNNNFKKGDCSCNKKDKSLPFKDDCNFHPQQGCRQNNQSDCGNKENSNCNGGCQVEHDNYPQDNHQQNNNQTNSSPFSNFNLKSLLPLLGGFGGGGNGLGNIMSMLGSVGGEKQNSSNNLDLNGIIKNLSSNGGLQNIINMFTKNGNNGVSGGGLGGLLGLFNKNKTADKTNNHPKTSDICIKDFKRVE